MTELYKQAIALVGEVNDTEYKDFHARRLVEMAGHIIMGYLLLGDATRNDSFTRSANVYINYAEAEVAKNFKFVSESNLDKMKMYKA